MKHRFLSFLLSTTLLISAAPFAASPGAASLLEDSSAVSLAAPPTVWLDGLPLSLPAAHLRNSTTYVPLRALTSALRPDWSVLWEDGQATVKGNQAGGIYLTFRPGESRFFCNGTEIGLSGPVINLDGRLVLPVRPLAAALGAEVDWSAEYGVTVSTGQSEQLYWLSRIISAESRGEPLEGQIAVGNVVLNRVASPEFPDTVYDVIFDQRWGGQFAPVRNGTIWNEPAESSILAARLCLAGASTVGDSLYFLAPALTDDRWAAENRDYVTTIGAHWFYR